MQNFIPFAQPLVQNGAKHIFLCKELTKPFVLYVYYKRSKRFKSTKVQLFYFLHQSNLVKQSIFFMITVFNRYLSENQRALEACKTLPGIGKTMAKQALDQLGINYNVKLKDLSTNQLHQLNYLILQRYKVTDELRAFVQKSKIRLSSISCYRGYRHSQALPCRGQRTHGNANTARKSKGTHVQKV